MDLRVGARVGQITVVGDPVTKDSKHTYSPVRCDCGKEWLARRDSIRKGKIISCGGPGCRRPNYKHGMAATSEYKIWAGMIQRCHNPRSRAYAWYGSRGITVCARWHSFDAFFADMGERPAGKTIERKDNQCGYGPENCVWASHQEQMQNTRITKFVSLNGERVSMAESARRLGVPLGWIYNWRRKGHASPQAAVNYYRAALGAR